MKAISAGVNKTKVAADSVKQQNTGQVNGKSDVSERWDLLFVNFLHRLQMKTSLVSEHLVSNFYNWMP